MIYGKKARLAAAACTLALLVSGCSLPTSDGAPPIDPPPVDAETMMRTGGDAAGKTPAGQTAEEGQKPGGKTEEASKEASLTTLYFEDGKGFVVPVSLPVPKSDAAAKTALEYMVEDGPGQKMIPLGFRALLPKGTRVNGIEVKDKVASVDFSAHFTNYNVQDERKILEAVTWTLTGFPDVEKVKLRVEGHDLPEMPADATPLDLPLSRAMGINLEWGQGINPGRTTSVTLYFPSRSEDLYGYLVPVTRLIPRTDNLPRAVIEELAKGPDASTGLLAALLPGTQVLSVGLEDDDSVVTVDFGSKFLDADRKASPESLQAVALSLSQSTSAGKVNITVNGTPAPAAGEFGATQAVDRAVPLNPYGL